MKTWLPWAMVPLTSLITLAGSRVYYGEAATLPPPQTDREKQQQQTLLQITEEFQTLKDLLTAQEDKIQKLTVAAKNAAFESVLFGKQLDLYKQYVQQKGLQLLAEPTQAEIDQFRTMLAKKQPGAF